MDKKTFEYEGYAKIDGQSGLIEIVDKDGNVNELARLMTGGRDVTTIRRIRVSGWIMGGNETESARFVFHTGRGK